MNKYGHRSPNSPASTAAPASRERLFAPPGRCPPLPHSRHRAAPHGSGRRGALPGETSALRSLGDRRFCSGSRLTPLRECPLMQTQPPPLLYIHLFPMIDVSLGIYLKTAQRRCQKVRIPRGTQPPLACQSRGSGSSSRSAEALFPSYPAPVVGVRGRGTRAERCRRWGDDTRLPPRLSPEGELSRSARS